MSNWINIKDKLPEHTYKFVLVKTKSKYANKVVARFVPKFTETDGADYEFGDYCSQKDAWFLPEGWYANVSPMCDEYLSYYLDEEVTHWQPLPNNPED